MLNKVLSFILGVVFCFFSVGNLNLAYATDNVESGNAQVSENIVIANKEDDEKISRVDSRRYNGIKNIINHPFRIVFRAGGWMILGALSSIVLPINGVVLSTIGLVCGAISKTIDLYEDGYDKD